MSEAFQKMTSLLRYSFPASPLFSFLSSMCRAQLPTSPAPLSFIPTVSDYPPTHSRTHTHSSITSEHFPPLHLARVESAAALRAVQEDDVTRHGPIEEAGGPGQCSCNCKFCWCHSTDQGITRRSIHTGEEEARTRIASSRTCRQPLTHHHAREQVQ
jgi:hypothetical protein